MMQALNIVGIFEISNCILCTSGLLLSDRIGHIPSKRKCAVLSKKEFKDNTRTSGINI